MSSLTWLGIMVVFVVAVVLTGHRPRGGKPVEGTKLMKAARSVLVVGVVACGVLGAWSVLRH